MPKVTYEANRLTDTKVDRVSLVKRASSRLPFRVQKSEDEKMLDLSKIGRSLFRKADNPPTLAAVILAKGVDPSVAAPIFRNAGITSEDQLKKSEDEHAQTFAVDGVEVGEDAGVLRINEDVAVVVTGLKKAFSGYDFKNTSFADVMAQGSFFPSVSVALDMMRHTAMNVMDGAESPEDAASKLKKAADEFSEYIRGLAAAIPVHAFKSEVAVQKAMPDFIKKKIEAKAAEKEGKSGETDEREEAKGKKKPPFLKEDHNEPISKKPVFGNDTEAPKWGTKSPNIEENPAAGNGTQKPKIPAADNDIEGDTNKGNDTQHPLPVKKAGDPDAEGGDDGPDVPGKEDFNTILANFADTLSRGIGEQLQKQGERLDGFGSKLDEMSSRVSKAEETVTNTIFGSETQDRTGAAFQKSEASAAPPLLDTGYDRSHLRPN